MPKRLKAILLFQKKLFLPSIVIAATIGTFTALAADGNLPRAIIISYFFISPVFHYFTYEVRNPDEYYFYANFGFSKMRLWGSTVGIGVLCLIISSFV